MKCSPLLVVLALTVIPASAVVLYSQPPSASGGLNQSSWWDPDGSDYDIYIWDSFILPNSQAITEVQWRGGFIYNGSAGGPVIDFSVEIWPSIAAGTQPNVVGQPLMHYMTGGNAGQTYAGTFGGKAMYDYHFTLPSAFQATAGVKYWLQIEASQNGIPEWGWTTGTGGNSNHFRFVHGANMYQNAPNDMAFSLIGTDAPTYTITTSASPANAGATTGAGAYPVGSQATVGAVANAGFGFVKWTENGTQVSTNPNYTFTVNSNRTLVANFTTAYTVTTAAAPSFGGATTGGGTFNSGSTATVTATPDPYFVFVNWTEFGTEVSTSSTYQFPASANRTLVANFVLASAGAIFDFDNAPPFTSLPLDVASGAMTARLSAGFYGYSIQYANVFGFTPAGFYGNCICPNTVFADDLHIGFPQASLTAFSILYSPQELGCDDSAIMRVTAYMDGVFVGTNTATAVGTGAGWPTGTLRISTAQPFNRVVVHYDSHPLTCQDWGPIFMADNMVVLGTVAPALCLGDIDCSGLVDFFDIDPFVEALSYPGGAGWPHPSCAWEHADCDGDGDVDFFDIDPFVAQIGVICP